MYWKITAIFFICAVPVVTIVLTAIYHLSPEYQAPGFFGAFPPLLTAFAGLTAVYTLILAVLVAILNVKNKTLLKKVESLGKANSGLIRQSQVLESKIDLLSATREISLILNEDVEFETILKKCLEIISQLANPKGEAEEVTIFLKLEEKGELIPFAQRKDSETYFEHKLKNKQINQSNVNEAFEHQRLFLSATGEEFDFSLPLIADREGVGVIKVKTTIEGEVAERMEEARQLQANLMEVGKIIALAIKTPTLYSRTITDPLTGLFSKRHFFTQMQTYFELSRRHKTPLSLVMMDIDHFKSINDNHGHPVGDIVLQKVSALVEQNIRKASSAYRYGGEEVAIILPNTDKAGAVQMAERLRKKIEAHKIITPENHHLKLTASMGVSEYQNEMVDFQELVKQTDNALYQAKQTGRNKVCQYS